MWPSSVFAAVKELGLEPEYRLTLSDHAEFDQVTIASIVDLAGSGGIVCTGKDSVKLISALPDSVPVWRIVEHVEWARGGSDLLGAVTQLAMMGTDRQATA
jgi:tetraacyldisaccharide-1-P 4'-kinase